MFYLFRGAPTAIEQSWPGCPCGGFMPGATVPPCAGGVNCGTGLRFGCGGRLREAPTGMSQRWLGAPCGGLTAAVVFWVLAGCVCAGAVTAGALGAVPVVLFSSLSEQLKRQKTETERSRCGVIFMV